MKAVRSDRLEGSCQYCDHFVSDPAAIEALFPGLTTMSSGFASVRDQDGFCRLHERYLSGRDWCPRLTGAKNRL